MTSSSLLERYLDGQCEQVWNDLYALGPDVRRLDHVDDALAVAYETMRRVRANCQILIPRLESLGWRFGYDWATDVDDDDLARTASLLGDPLPPPVLDELERRYGLMPLAFRAFYEIVGEVNFVGTPFARADWPAPEDGLDPLYVAPVSDITESQPAPDPELGGCSSARTRSPSTSSAASATNTSSCPTAEPTPPSCSTARRSTLAIHA